MYKEFLECWIVSEVIILSVRNLLVTYPCDYIGTGIHLLRRTGCDAVIMTRKTTDPKENGRYVRV